LALGDLAGTCHRGVDRHGASQRTAGDDRVHPKHVTGEQRRDNQGHQRDDKTHADQ